MSVYETLNQFYKVLQMGDYTTGLRLAERILSNDPGNPNNWVNYAICLYEIGSYFEASQAFLQVYEMIDYDPTVYYRICLALAKAEMEYMLFEIIKKTLKRDHEFITFLILDPTFVKYMARDELKKYKKKYRNKINSHYKSRVLLDQGDIFAALPEMEAVLYDDPWNPIMWYNYGEALFELGRYVDAGEAFSQAYEFAPDDGNAIYKLCVCLARTNDVTKLMQVMKIEYEKDPNFFRIIFSDKIFEKYVKSEDFKAVSVKIEKKSKSKTTEIPYIETFQPDDVDELFDKGITSIYNGKFSVAIQNFTKIITKDPNNILAWDSLGSAYYYKKEYDQAIEAFQRAITLNPNYIKPLYNIGLVHRDKNEYDKAIEYFRKVLELDPNFHDAWDSMGTCYATQKDEEKAEKAFARASKLQPSDIEVLKRSANDAYNKKEINKAIDGYRKIIELEPQDLQSLKRLAIMYNAKREYNSAIEIYEKIFELNPEDLITLKNITKIYVQMGNYDDAIKFCKKIIELDQNNIKAMLIIGLAYEKKNEHDKAIESYKKVLEINPKNAKVWGKIGDVHKNAGHSSQAIKHYEKAIKLEPHDPRMWNKLGNYYASKDKHDKSIKCFKKVVELDPTFFQDKEKKSS